MCLIDTVLDISAQIFKNVSETLKTTISTTKSFELKDEDRVGAKLIKWTEYTKLKGDLTHIAIILDLMNSQLFKGRLISLDFILTTSKLLEMCENQKFEGIEDFMHTLLMIVECLSSIRKALLDAHEPILQHLLPWLLNNLNNYSTNFWFLSLKIFADITTQYLSDEAIYDVIGSNNFSKGLNKLILKQLFPKYGVILSDSDPVPLFGLKLLSIIIEKNPAFITILKNLNLISVITNYFSVGHARLNWYTIKIIKHLVESKTLSIEDLQALEVPKRANEIILNMLESK